jgi:hypothetical protein
MTRQGIEESKLLIPEREMYIKERAKIQSPVKGF